MAYAGSRQWWADKLVPIWVCSPTICSLSPHPLINATLPMQNCYQLRRGT